MTNGTAGSWTAPWRRQSASPLINRKPTRKPDTPERPLPNMKHKPTYRSLARCAAAATLLASLPLWGQPTAPADQPLTALPHSPGLDLRSLDRSADPCVDFYRFSCGGWQQANPIPPDHAQWDVYGKLQEDNFRFLWGLLIEAAVPRPERTPAEQKS